MSWIIGIAVACIMFLLFMNRGQRKMNPVNSLSYDGILGIKIGDSKEFVVSRIKHLKLLNEADVRDQPMIFKYGFETSFISFGRGVYNNIEKIGIGFDKSVRVDSLSIDFENYHSNMKETFNSVRYKIEDVLGKPTFVESDSITWLSGNKCVGIYNDKTTVSAVINRI